METKKCLFTCLLFFLLCHPLFAQQDSIKQDSTQLYKNIETYSKKSKFTDFLFKTIFKPVAPVFKKTVYKKLIQKPYSVYEGKIIRNIEIVSLDPFGYSVTDTIVRNQKFYTNTGNKLHLKTQPIAILNLLLFRKNDPFNSFLVKESERLIRNQIYVHDVSFSVLPAGNKSDSVDIFIRELDKWTIIPAASVSNSGFKIELTDKNIIGSGHEFQSSFVRNSAEDVNFFNTDYAIPNIKQTHINGKLHFGIDGHKNLTQSIMFERPFYSPLAKWAGGISLSSEVKNDSIKFGNAEYVPLNLKFNTYDFWAANSIQLLKGREDKESITKLIFAVRFLRLRYFEKPVELYDPLNIYETESFIFAGIGISQRKYVQDKYIFKYGVIEDVPVGKVYQLTGGYQERNKSGRYYLGMKFSFGNYTEWGYLSSGIEYGTFFRGSNAEQGVFTAGVNYFTGLIESGKWKFRQFIKPEVTFGINRFAYDSLTLKDGYGLDGFNSTALSGTSRLIFTFQTQSYSPWTFLGFHFGPFLIFSLGKLGNIESGFKNSRLYSQIGLGVLVKNENLIFNTFQFSISYYPVIPGYGLDVFKFNSFKTSDIGFNDFEIGKPVVTHYR